MCIESDGIVANFSARQHHMSIRDVIYDRAVRFAAACSAGPDWVFDDEGRTAVWNMLKNGPAPVGSTRR